MTERGPDSDESGPRSAAAEAARRRLYMPGGGSPEAVDAFERLAEPVPPVRQDEEADAEAEAPSRPGEAHADPRRPTGRTRRRRVVLGVVLGAAAAVVVALVLQAVGPRALPTAVAVPRLAGTTLLYHQRMSNPASAPDRLTLDPDSYTLFFPKGRRVGVALRCVGGGTVQISAAGEHFVFHCSKEESLQVRATPGGVARPFLILGRTVGNVVWSVRVVLLPPVA